MMMSPRPALRDRFRLGVRLKAQVDERGPPPSSIGLDWLEGSLWRTAQRGDQVAGDDDEAQASTPPRSIVMKCLEAPHGAPRSEETRRPVMMMRPRPALRGGCRLGSDVGIGLLRAAHQPSASGMTVL